MQMHQYNATVALFWAGEGDARICLKGSAAGHKASQRGHIYTPRLGSAELYKSKMRYNYTPQ